MVCIFARFLIKIIVFIAQLQLCNCQCIGDRRIKMLRHSAGFGSSVSDRTKQPLCAVNMRIGSRRQSALTGDRTVFAAAQDYLARFGIRPDRFAISAKIWILPVKIIGNFQLGKCHAGHAVCCI